MKMKLNSTGIFVLLLSLSLSLLLTQFLISCAAEPADSEDTDDTESSDVGDDDDDDDDNDTGDHGFNGLDDGVTIDNDDLEWQNANLTWFESYPDPGSEECIEFNGCEWAGHLALNEGVKKPESWIRNTHIVAVLEDDYYSKYAGKILRIKQGPHQIDAKVYDLCSDNDCSGCCSQNSWETGFLIDMEIYTFNKFGGEHGITQFACLDCD